MNDKFTEYAPDGSWRIEIYWQSGRMSHEIACPVVYDKEGKEIFSLAEKSFELRNHTYDAQGATLTLHLVEYPDSKKYDVQLNLNEGTGVIGKTGSKLTISAPISELRDKLSSLAHQDFQSGLPQRLRKYWGE